MCVRFLYLDSPRALSEALCTLFSRTQSLDVYLPERTYNFMDNFAANLAIAKEHHKNHGPVEPTPAKLGVPPSDFPGGGAGGSGAAGSRKRTLGDAMENAASGSAAKAPKGA